jgi:hypothetical protein
MLPEGAQIDWVLIQNGSVLNVAANVDYVQGLSAHGELERAAGHTITIEMNGS